MFILVLFTVGALNWRKHVWADDLAKKEDCRASECVDRERLIEYIDQLACFKSGVFSKQPKAIRILYEFFETNIYCSLVIKPSRALSPRGYAGLRQYSHMAFAFMIISAFYSLHYQTKDYQYCQRHSALQCSSQYYYLLGKSYTCAWTGKKCAIQYPDYNGRLILLACLVACAASSCLYVLLHQAVGALSQRALDDNTVVGRSQQRIFLDSAPGVSAARNALQVAPKPMRGKIDSDLSRLFPQYKQFLQDNLAMVADKVATDEVAASSRLEKSVKEVSLYESWFRNKRQGDVGQYILLLLVADVIEMLGDRDMDAVKAVFFNKVSARHTLRGCDTTPNSLLRTRIIWISLLLLNSAFLCVTVYMAIDQSSHWFSNYFLCCFCYFIIDALLLHPAAILFVEVIVPLMAARPLWAAREQLETFTDALCRDLDRAAVSTVIFPAADPDNDAAIVDRLARCFTDELTKTAAEKVVMTETIATEFTSFLISDAVRHFDMVSGFTCEEVDVAGAFARAFARSVVEDAFSNRPAEGTAPDALPGDCAPRNQPSSDAMFRHSGEAAGLVDQRCLGEGIAEAAIKEALAGVVIAESSHEAWRALCAWGQVMDAVHNRHNARDSYLPQYWDSVLMAARRRVAEAGAVQSEDAAGEGGALHQTAAAAPEEETAPLSRIIRGSDEATAGKAVADEATAGKAVAAAVEWLVSRVELPSSPSADVEGGGVEFQCIQESLILIPNERRLRSESGKRESRRAWAVDNFTLPASAVTAPAYLLSLPYFFAPSHTLSRLHPDTLEAQLAMQVRSPWMALTHPHIMHYSGGCAGRALLRGCGSLAIPAQMALFGSLQPLTIAATIFTVYWFTEDDNLCIGVGVALLVLSLSILVGLAYTLDPSAHFALREIDEQVTCVTVSAAAARSLPRSDVNDGIDVKDDLRESSRSHVIDIGEDAKGGVECQQLGDSLDIVSTVFRFARPPVNSDVTLIEVKSSSGWQRLRRMRKTFFVAMRLNARTSELEGAATAEATSTEEEQSKKDKARKNWKSVRRATNAATYARGVMRKVNSVKVRSVLKVYVAAETEAAGSSGKMREEVIGRLRSRLDIRRSAKHKIEDFEEKTFERAMSMKRRKGDAEKSLERRLQSKKTILSQQSLSSDGEAPGLGSRVLSAMASVRGMAVDAAPAANEADETSRKRQQQRLELVTRKKANSAKQSKLVTSGKDALSMFGALSRVSNNKEGDDESGVLSDAKAAKEEPLPHLGSLKLPTPANLPLVRGTDADVTSGALQRKVVKSLPPLLQQATKVQLTAELPRKTRHHIDSDSDSNSDSDSDSDNTPPMPIPVVRMKLPSVQQKQPQQQRPPATAVKEQPQRPAARPAHHIDSDESSAFSDSSPDSSNESSASASDSDVSVHNSAPVSIVKKGPSKGWV